MDSTEDKSVKEGGEKLEPTNDAQTNGSNGEPDYEAIELNSVDNKESKMKEKESEVLKESGHDVNENKEKLADQDGDVETKFVAVENKNLRTSSFVSSKGTPNTARKRKHARHTEEISVAEMISLSGMESICSLSNFDAMSFRDEDEDDEEAGGEGGAGRKKGIQPHHILAVLLGMMSIAIILLLYFLVPCPCVPDDWDKEMELKVSRSPVRLTDVNRDGMEDIIFGYGYSHEYEPIEDMEEYCQYMNVSSPCGGGVMALNGWRGDLLWELRTNQTITSLICNQLDANGDGQMDCLATGYEGQAIAIDGKTGAMIWSADQSVTVPTWSYTQPQALPKDLDGDGVLDLVVTHGHEPTSQEGNSTGPGRLILLSGRTGKSIGNFLEMPDAMTTACPPVVYQASDDAKAEDAAYVVFGSGGSGIQGSMWMISVDQLFCDVTGSSSSCTKQSPDQYEPIRRRRADEGPSFIELVKGSGNGFEIPAVLADMTQDGINDLVIVSHDAVVTVINGSSLEPLEPLWVSDGFSGSYIVQSVPAPGYFDEDEVPDILIHLIPSLASEDNKDKIVILNGTNGDEMWSTTSMGSDLSPLVPSTLSLKADGEKDAFAFWLRSENEETETTTMPAEDWCSGFSTILSTLSLFMMDRDMARSPAVLLSTSSSVQPSNWTATTPKPMMTTLPPAGPHSTVLDVTAMLGTVSGGPIQSVTNSTPPGTADPLGRRRRRREAAMMGQEKGCYHMEPVVFSTGVIGDFEKDGTLEVIVFINTLTPPTLPSSSSLVNTLTIHRFDLGTALNQNIQSSLDKGDTYVSPGLGNVTVSGDLFDHFSLQDTNDQSWFAYMGTNGDGMYS